VIAGAVAQPYGPRPHYMKKKFIIAGICAAAACAAGALAYLGYSGTISYSGSFPADVKSKIVLERDKNGTPVIVAKSFEDVYFGLGYLHAQDRYAMMEYFRAAAAGASAGIIGKDGRALDRLSRAIDFAGRAHGMVSRIREPYAGYLKDYARGVNEARRQLGLSDTVPRHWTAEDVIAVLALREWGNTFLNNRETVFPFQRDELVADLKEILPEELIYYYNESESDCVEVVRKIRALVGKYLGVFDRGYAFYLPAQKTRDNYPVTAFSFDDMLSLYPGWYPVHVHCEDRVIKGITSAGLPFIFAGNNTDISFYGFTANIDTQDIIAETIIKTGKTHQYLDAFGWRDFDTMPGRKGEGGAPIHATGNGPVLNDIFDNPEYGSAVVTIRSVFFEPEYIVSLFDIPLSRTIAAAGACTRGVRSLPRVYLFSSDEEARRVWSGLVPARKKTDSMLKAGADAVWNGMIDLSLLPDPADVPPAAGSSFVSDAPLPARENALPEDFRYARLKKLLDKKKRFTARDVENVLEDKYSPIAGLFLPQFLKILGDNPMASARLTRVYFQNWKYRMKSEFVGPSILHKLLQRFMYETYADDLKDQIDNVLERWDLLAPKFYILVENNKSPIFDDRTTYAIEYSESIFDRAFLTTMRFFNRKLGTDINNWSWGSLHRGRFSVPGRAEKAGDIPFDGGSDTLYRGSLGTSLEPVEVTSLMGMFGVEESVLFMNFTYSTDPRSAFYYGSAERKASTPFHEISGTYITTITPKKK
jgi:penicillin G amidase